MLQLKSNVYDWMDAPYWDFWCSSWIVGSPG